MTFTYILNNWDAATRRLQDKNVFGCSAEGHVSHMYSDRMSSRPMAWSDEGADAMCHLRCYVKDYGSDRIIDLVKYRRKKSHLKATGTDGINIAIAKEYTRAKHTESAMEAMKYAEAMHGTIPGLTIRKTLAIRERLNNI